MFDTEAKQTSKLICLVLTNQECWIQIADGNAVANGGASCWDIWWRHDSGRDGGGNKQGGEVLSDVMERLVPRGQAGAPGVGAKDTEHLDAAGQRPGDHPQPQEVGQDAKRRACVAGPWPVYQWLQY